MVKIIEFLISIFSKLPTDPFVSYLKELDDTLSIYVGYINWIVPVKSMFTITSVWAGVILAAKALLIIFNVLLKKIAS